MSTRFRLLFGFCFAALAAASAGAQRAKPPHWIWLGEAKDDAECYLRKQFRISRAVVSARVIATCDNSFEMWVNGKRVLTGRDWTQPQEKEIGALLQRGQNLIAVRAVNEGGAAGFIARVAVRTAAGNELVIVTDRSWKGALEEQENWNQPAFDDKPWTQPKSLGRVGAAPWTQIQSNSLGDAPAPLLPQPAKPAEGLELLPDFRAEIVYDVPPGAGSWVSLCVDDEGRIITSDQGRGLYRITPAEIGKPDSKTSVERLDVSLGGAQGLLWAFDSLYVVANGRDSGLYRLRDTTGDGKLDENKKLLTFKGAGEHGPHGVIVAPSGRTLYVAAGNHTDAPEFQTSRQPSNWGEDLLLPRLWDPRGHARGRLAPGGWIVECNPDGSAVDLISSGYRNEYDIALSRHGELFTYDADMEWDLGMPWYRPTRICHAVSGSEFGWRSGSGKWPPYYPDSLPAVLDIGPGSPTGVLFGTGARFPTRFQDALFLLDWTYGTMYAVHLEEDGASFKATKQEFLSGRPLALTDAVIGLDGAMYFAVGGRNTKSLLYRVFYTGKEAMGPPHGGDPEAAKLRELRRSLERFHGRADPKAVDIAWEQLGHEDRHVRYAARIALESQPVMRWRQRAVSEMDGKKALTALLALTRQGSSDDLPAALAALARFDPARMPEAPLLELLRSYALAFIRLGEPGPTTRRSVIRLLDPIYPHESSKVNIELARLLVYLDSPTVIEKTLAVIAKTQAPPAPKWFELIARNDRYGGTVKRMLENMPPVDKIQLVHILRNVAHGWTLQQRREYFAAFKQLSDHPGGESYAKYLMNIRAAALMNCSDAERHAVADLTGETLAAVEPFQPTPPVGPGQDWKVDTAVTALGGQMHGRSFESGRNLFHAATCVKCHRFDGEGGAIGPDLSSVGNKFSMRDLLESIIEPSKTISDQYGSSIVTRTDGSEVFGLVVKSDDHVDVYPKDPWAEAIRIKKSEIRSIEASLESQMPVDLVDKLSPTELADLVAYLLSRGNPKDAAFRK